MHQKRLGATALREKQFTFSFKSCGKIEIDKIREILKDWRKTPLLIIRTLSRGKFLSR